MSSATSAHGSDLTILLGDTPAAAALPAAWPTDTRVTVVDQCDVAAAAAARKLFVVTTATALPAVAPCVSRANRANRLQALLVRSDVPATWVPFLFEEAGLRVLRNVLVHGGGDLPARFLTAWAHGEQHETIADAAVVGDALVIRSCAFDVHRITFDAYPALRRIRPGDHAAFEIDPDGLFLHWPAADVHLDLDAVRAAGDPAYRAHARAQQLAEDAAFGQAVRAVREACGLTQIDVATQAGLSDRHVRRIETGTPPSDEVLDHLAAAHGMSPDAYLDAVSEHMGPLPNDETPLPRGARAATSSSRHQTSSRTPAHRDEPRTRQRAPRTGRENLAPNARVGRQRSSGSVATHAKKRVKK